MGQEAAIVQPRQEFVNPTQPTADYVWKVIITAVVVVLVGSFLAIAVSIFLKIDNSLIQVLLTVFTSLMTFVGGLLIKSPVQPSGN